MEEKVTIALYKNEIGVAVPIGIEDDPIQKVACARTGVSLLIASLKRKLSDKLLKDWAAKGYSKYGDNGFCVFMKPWEVSFGSGGICFFERFFEENGIRPKIGVVVCSPHGTTKMVSLYCGKKIPDVFPAFTINEDEISVFGYERPEFDWRKDYEDVQDVLVHAMDTSEGTENMDIWVGRFADDGTPMIWKV